MDPVQVIKSSRGRNGGIDALRIASMYMVVLLHMLGHGGLLASCESRGARYAMLGLQTAAFCAVNLFGMISGYLMFGRKVRYARLITLWLQVVFYGLVITILAKTIWGTPVSVGQWLCVLLPVSFKVYWYFSAYFGLFIFMPFINRMLESLSRKQDKALGLGLLLIITISTASPTEAFMLNDGYSLMWLCMLYILGALIRKHEQELTLKSMWLALDRYGSRCFAVYRSDICRMYHCGVPPGKAF